MTSSITGVHSSSAWPATKTSTPASTTKSTPLSCSLQHLIGYTTHRATARRTLCAQLFLNLTPNKLTPQGGTIDSIEKAHYVGASVIAYGAFLLYLFQFLVVVFAAILVLRWLKSMNAAGGADAEI